MFSLHLSIYHKVHRIKYRSRDSSHRQTGFLSFFRCAYLKCRRQILLGLLCLLDLEVVCSRLLFVEAYFCVKVVLVLRGRSSRYHHLRMDSLTKESLKVHQVLYNDNIHKKRKEYGLERVVSSQLEGA